MDSNIFIVLVLALFLAIVGTPGSPTSHVVPASAGDVTLLARLIDVEARGEIYRGKVAVGAVVVNRMRDPRFPTTLRDVIYEPRQFYTAGLSSIRVPTAESRQAAEAALRGEDPTQGALFFYNPETATSNGWWETRPRQTRIGNHVFTR